MFPRQQSAAGGHTVTLHQAEAARGERESMIGRARICAQGAQQPEPRLWAGVPELLFHVKGVHVHTRPRPSDRVPEESEYEREREREMEINKYITPSM